MSDTPQRGTDKTETAPARQAAQLRSRLDIATERLLRTAAGITDAQAREPSRLPGWSRGHLLTHIARNADGLRNLLIWARTGVETPMYATPDARAEGIAAGAGRSAADLRTDLETSAIAFAAEAASLADADWAAAVRGPGGVPHMAWFTLWRRLSEVEIHHVDLGSGYRPDDWPEAFAKETLTLAADRLTTPDVAAALLVSADDASTRRIGPAEAQPELEIAGPTRQLLAWLIGRSTGDELATKPAGPLPPLPAW